MQTSLTKDHLHKQNIPSFSVSGAIVELGKQDLSLNQALEQIEMLTSIRPDVTDVHEANLMYHYLIQDSLQLLKKGVETVETSWIMESTLKKAKTYKAKNPFVFATGDGFSSVRNNTTVEKKQKKGWKQARAIELLRANPNMERKQILQLFVNELQMTPACANTYLFNLKKESLIKQ